LLVQLDQLPAWNRVTPLRTRARMRRSEPALKRLPAIEFQGLLPWMSAIGRNRNLRQAAAMKT
jgi:hypothetical protein